MIKRKRGIKLKAVTDRKIILLIFARGERIKGVEL